MYCFIFISIFIAIECNCHSTIINQHDYIAETKCDVATVQNANAVQLHSILSELSNTAFFRLFRVDNNPKTCEYFFTKKKSPPTQSESSSDEEEDEDSSKQCGQDAVSFGQANNFGEGRCSITPPEEMPKKESSIREQPPISNKRARKNFYFPPHKSQVVTHSRYRPFEIVNKSISNEEYDITDCSKNDLKPDFWLDICSSSSSSTNTSFVNLQLNPERNTGYRGGHIWQAIYAENCLKISEKSVHPFNSSRPPLFNFEQHVQADTCIEERVLFRILSGWHSSVTIAIAHSYYPPGSSQGNTEWRSNPELFMRVLGEHPERLKNLHFAFVVLLRALFKAKPILYNMDFTLDQSVDQETRLLMRHLLDSSVMKSCGPIFTAFDETILFVGNETNKLAREFKLVFQNITELVDCVSCQRCRLHAKVTIMGIGSALKILLTPNLASIGRDEIVALVNTLYKLSDSIILSERLSESYHSNYFPITDDTEMTKRNLLPKRNLLDRAVQLVSILSRTGDLKVTDEARLIDAILQGDERLLVLARHYSHSPMTFANHALRYLNSDVFVPDAAVIGGGLAGMVAAISILDRGGSVVMLEKQAFLGGNSAKASSGINRIHYEGEDSFDKFLNDTLASSVLNDKKLLNRGVYNSLASILVNQSITAVDWLSKRIDLPLTKVSRLGGHSSARTFRPELGIVGAELTFHLGRKLQEYSASNRFKLHFNSELSNLVVKNGSICQVEWRGDGKSHTVDISNVILATGGFGFDHQNMVYKYRPDLDKFPTTLGSHTTGDGIKLAERIGAKLEGMEDVQLHPTGFVDPKDPEAHTKVLCAEMIRGIGGLLINPNNGSRFVNELGTRAYVTSKMLEVAIGGSPIPIWLLLPKRSVEAAKAEKHLQIYTHKGMLAELSTNDVISKIGFEKNLRQSLTSYARSVDGTSHDLYGKTSFYGNSSWYELDDNSWYLGQVTPVIHYTMGGVAIDDQARVLTTNASIISGLYAIGEVAGGVHGKNRLGGNSLLECTVFGRLVGNSIPIANPSKNDFHRANARAKLNNNQMLDFLSTSDLTKYANQHDKLLVSLFDLVYDFTLFEHPGGSITNLVGKNATDIFEAAHSEEMLKNMGFAPIGRLLGP